MHELASVRVEAQLMTALRPIFDTRQLVHAHAVSHDQPPVDTARVASPDVHVTRGQILPAGPVQGRTVPPALEFCGCDLEGDTCQRLTAVFQLLSSTAC